MAGNVGQWEEVNPNEDYYQKNAYVSDGGESSDTEPELKKLERKMEKETNDQNVQKEQNELNAQDEENEQKIKIFVENKQGNKEEKDAIDELLEYKDQTNFGKSALKLKNERLIKLAEENFELGVFEKPMYKKNKEKEEDAVGEKTMFKKRKSNTAKALLIKPEDSP